jgi:hypothetical protein
MKLFNIAILIIITTNHCMLMIRTESPQAIYRGARAGVPTKVRCEIVARTSQIYEHPLDNPMTPGQIEMMVRRGLDQQGYSCVNNDSGLPVLTVDAAVYKTHPNPLFFGLTVFLLDLVPTYFGRLTVDVAVSLDIANKPHRFQYTGNYSIWTSMLFIPTGNPEDYGKKKVREIIEDDMAAFAMDAAFVAGAKSEDCFDSDLVIKDGRRIYSARVSRSSTAVDVTARDGRHWVFAPEEIVKVDR